VIDRALVMWSNPGDTVLSPFMGIGSEGVESVKNGRKFIGVELKESYFRQAVKNLEAEDRQGEMFGGGRQAL
jgi:DNA modification methylase